MLNRAAGSTWTEQHHALGVPQMDATHRQFLTLLQALNRAEDVDMPVLFRQLIDHTRLHFAEEGRLMRVCGFPALTEHEGEHHRVLGEMLQFDRMIKRGRLSLPRAYVRVGLPEWFELHLSTMDQALARHLQAHAPAAHPIAV